MMKTCQRGLHLYEGSQCPECEKTCKAAWHKVNAERIKGVRAARRIAGKCAVVECGQPIHWSNNNRCLRHTAEQGIRYHGVGFDRRMVMYENQGGACLICGTYEPDPVALHVDHDHATEAVRGLLCGMCNPGLGYFRDNPDLLTKAASYLKEAPIGPRV